MIFFSFLYTHSPYPHSFDGSLVLFFFYTFVIFFSLLFVGTLHLDALHSFDENLPAGSGTGVALLFYSEIILWTMYVRAYNSPILYFNVLSCNC